MTERGTTTAALDYAREVRRLGQNPVIAYDSNHQANNPLVLNQIRQEFEVIAYRNFSALQKEAVSKFDYFYAIKSGERDGIEVKGIPNFVHVVFQVWQPHGEVYAHVSAWLARRLEKRASAMNLISKMKFSNFPEYQSGLYVPHMVTLPDNINIDWRSELKIPVDATVGLRYGGRDSFDIPWVHSAIKNSLERNKNLYYIFANTSPFINHRRVSYLPVFYGAQARKDLLTSADFFLHARKRGESFGLSILEAMALRVPVLAWKGGKDRNHLELLSSTSLYSDPRSLIDKIEAIRSYSDIDRNLKVARNFDRVNVMKKFVDTFLSHL
jgi:glycosyltransferase involved in cell wall biosynthesis